MRHWLVAMALVATAPASWAQGYGGNYFNSSQASVDALNGQVNNSMAAMRQRQNQTIQMLMQDPRVQASYQQYLQRGGSMPYPQYAYQYGLTGGFTAQGAAMARQSIDANTAAEAQAYQGYMNAQQQRAQAQAGYQADYSANQQEAGRLLQGMSSWADPATGMTYQLPHAEPNQPLYDPQTGRSFAMDNRGNYYISTPDGRWQPLQPYR